MTIGQVIKDNRLKPGHSQEYLATKLGVSRQTISNWENERTIPVADYLKELSQLYGFSFDAVIGLETPSYNKKKLVLKYGLLILILTLLLLTSEDSTVFYAYLTVGVIFILFLVDISKFIRKKVALWKGKENQL
ncbi:MULTISPECIES: helix-turn-helix transcriptional regulator [Streptococcus]|uniref:helix-turn-helix transcriptional regulator n=1 Tax=Streptococcus TaxID=1301 RepID=UPI0019247D7A|nr:MULTISPECIES: helix-turn-helix transcriptional regulator [unclassified Streptococcus]QTH47741.1 helix-turn-helix transcriptional regulator [Streptococcus sp. zg-86]